jgi:hypothetical protein
VILVYRYNLQFKSGRTLRYCLIHATRGESMRMSNKSVSGISRRHYSLCIAAAAGLASGGYSYGQIVTDWTGAAATPLPWVSAGANWSNGQPVNTNNNATDYSAQVGNGGIATISGSDVAEGAFVHLGLLPGQSGTLQISGGTANFGEMRIGGRYQLPDTTFNGGGTGAVVQTGGDVNVNYTTGTEPPVQSLYLADGGLDSGNTAVGSYLIQAGTLNVGIATNDAIVVGTGSGSVGSFTQQGGAVNSTGTITVARNGATGTYNFSGGNLFSVANFVLAEGSVSFTGTGATMTQSGGTLQTSNYLGGIGGTQTLSGSVYVGHQGGSATYNMQNGLLNPAGDIWVGHGESSTATTSGTFTQTGGVVQPGALLSIGRLGGTGVYTISGGSIKSVGLNIGYGGTGTLTQSNNTNVTSTASMSVGITATTAGIGTYTLQSGTLTVGSASGDVIAVGNGAASTGVFNQNGGAVVMGQGGIQLGRNNGSSGQYFLNAGTINIANTLYLGGGNNQASGNGTMTQSAGTSVTIGSNFNLGANASATNASTCYGLYNMNGGGLTLTAAAAIWAIGNGLGSVGTFVQSGGTASMLGATASIDMGRNGGSATYNLNGGVLNVTKIALSTTNTAASRQFNVAGGTLNATAVDMGTATTLASRTFSISSGTANITNFTLGNSGALLSISGGTPNITNLTLGSGSKLLTSVPLSMASVLNLGNTTVEVSGGALTFAGGITNGSRTLTKTGTGPLTITGTQNNTGTATNTVTAGTMTYVSDPGVNLTVNANAGTTNFNTVGSTHLKALNVPSGGKAVMQANPNRTMYTGTLTVDPNGVLDLNDNDLAVTTGNFSTLQNLVLAGYRPGPDTTATGIISSTSQNVHGGTTILALFDNSLAGFPDWPQGSGNTVAGTAILGKYTYIGDTNMDGQVTPQDYTATDSNLGTSVSTAISWFYGDTNFDGNIDPTDYAGIDGALGLGVGNPLSAQGLSSVPEPTSIGLIGVAGAGMMMRRRRNSRG